MNTYEVKFYVGSIGSTTTIDTVVTNSEYNAKQIILARYPGQEVHILSVRKV